MKKERQYVLNFINPQLMENVEFISQCLSFIERAKLDDAIEMLKERTKGNHKKYAVVVHYSYQIADIQNSERLGVLNRQDARNERNNIVLGLIEFCLSNKI